MTTTLLLPGAPYGGRAEPYIDHLRRLGPLPRGARDSGGADLMAAVETAGLVGRGGGGFPVWRKWRAVADRARGSAVVLVNGAEGEPASGKDRLLMATRPHLVLDGALLAADAVGASDIVVYIGAEQTDAREALARALRERGADIGSRRIRTVLAPRGYVSGEETAAVRAVDGGPALPTSAPPRPFARGVGGRPTLVQNVETLACVGLIARVGGGWWREHGSVLVTVGGAVRHPGIREIRAGTPLGVVVEAAGVSSGHAILIGGYFGGWSELADVATAPLEHGALRARGLLLGCGVLSVLPERSCGLATAATIATYLARESAQQCGPCVNGLAAVAGALGRLASMTATPADVGQLEIWVSQLPGRGACRHPDGAALHVASALRVFADDVHAHVARRLCIAGAAVSTARAVA